MRFRAVSLTFLYVSGRPVTLFKPAGVPITAEKFSVRLRKHFLSPQIPPATSPERREKHLETGRGPASPALSTSKRRGSADRKRMTICHGNGRRADTLPAGVRPARPPALREESQSAGKLSKRHFPAARESRIPVPPRLTGQIRDSRGPKVDILTPCHAPPPRLPYDMLFMTLQKLSNEASRQPSW